MDDPPFGEPVEKNVLRQAYASETKGLRYGRIVRKNKWGLAFVGFGTDIKFPKGLPAIFVALHSKAFSEFSIRAEPELLIELRASMALISVHYGILFHFQRAGGALYFIMLFSTGASGSLVSLQLVLHSVKSR